MSYNPEDPIIINVSQLANTDSGNLLKRYCYFSTQMTEKAVDSFTAFKKGDAGILKGTQLESFANSFFANNPTGVFYVYELGAMVTGDNPDTAKYIQSLAKITTFIESGINACYEYILPREYFSLHDVIAPLKTMISGFDEDGTFTHFGIELAPGVDYGKNADFQTLKKLGNLFFVLGSDTGVDGQSPIGAITAIKASSKYDISQTNKMTQLQWKSVKAVNANVINNAYITMLTENKINYIGTFNEDTTIMMGCFVNGKMWDYEFSLSLFLLRTEDGLRNALYNSSNVRNARIAYDQNGIDTLLSVINNVGLSSKSLGILTEFGSSMENNAIQDKDSFKAIDFQTYIVQQPTKYQDGIYDGLSGVVRISRFFRQVIFNLQIA